MSALSVQPPFPIITDIDGQPLEDGYIWIGQTNLDPQTNPINVYWDAALTIPAAQPIRTLGGYPANSGTPARLYVNSDYSIRIMNKTGSVIYSAPSATERYNQSVILNISASNVDFIQTGTGAITRSLQSKSEDFVSVKDFGAIGDGITDDRIACQAAIDAVIAAGGGTVYFPEGQYLISGTSSPDSTLDGLLIPYSSANNFDQRVILRGAGRSTVLKAGSPNMYIVRFSDSHGGVHDLSLDANAMNSVIGLGCVPENVNQTTDQVFQNFNIFSGLYISGCQEGLVLRTGPDVGGGDSGCWYNTLQNTHIFSCTRGVWFRDGPNASSSGVNRNSFINVRIGQNCNTGLQIDSGGTNKFYAVDFEGINSFVSPNAVPTAVYIAASGLFSGDNNSNEFIGCSFEGNTRDLDNSNPFSEFVSCGFGSGKVNTSSGAPYGTFCVGGNDPSQVPQISAGITYQTNNQIPGLANGATFRTTTGSAGFDLNATIFTTRSFEETSGASGSIANGATFIITIPTPRRPQMLFLYSDSNLNNPGLYLLCGDGAGNITVSTIVNNTQVMVVGSAANQVTVTNNYGVSANIRYTLTPFGVAA